MKWSRRWVAVVAGCAMTVALSMGQAPRREKSPEARFGQAVRSPEVQADGRVTFRFHAPNARAVFLAREDAPRQAMTRDEQGTWSVTTKPLEPDLYSYQFVVDRLPLEDPANPLCVSVVTGGHKSIAHVRGPASLSWEINDVPHGILHRHRYKSGMFGEVREYWVYTPPGYDAADPRKYPVLYLLHGVLEEASAWMSVGRANVILDNLIAQNKAQPMLLVAPCGYGFPNAADRVGELFQFTTNQRQLMKDMARSLLDEVIPQVEQNYRVAAEPGSRAVAGLSMGGAQAIYLGLNYPRSFAWVGSFSGAFIMYGGQYEKFFPELDAYAKAPHRLLWLSCGGDDFLLSANRRCKEWLQSKGIACTAKETPGRHAWTVWRRNLTEFASWLFRANAK